MVGVAPIALASEIIGFISFSITLLTLLGVYSSLLSTLRSAPTRIPIVLGNLRQEILAERAYLRQRIAEGRDPYGVFPRMMPDRRGGTAPGASTRMRQVEREQEGYARLLAFTVRDLWMEFRSLERPFLVKGGLRAKAIEKGDYWSEKDVMGTDVEKGEVSDYSEDEKGGTRRRRRTRRERKRRRRLEERKRQEEEEIFRGDEEEWELDRATEDMRREGAKYYNTDFSHRFIWWQCEDEVNSLAEQVQRIQIRRMERDLFETDELVRRLIEGAGRGGSKRRGRPVPDGGSGSGSEDEIIVDNRGARSRVGSRAPSRGNMSSAGRDVREVEETERVVRSAARSPAPATTQRPSDREREANVAARRTARRRRSPIVEYEVLRPRGGGYVVVDSNYRGNLPPGARVVNEGDLSRSRRRSPRD